MHHRFEKKSETKFYTETTITAKKHNRSNVRYNNKSIVEKEQAQEKDKKVGTQQPCFVPKHHHHGDHDQHVLFFSSISISSDSSSGGFSSSDTESIMPRASCFAPSKPKPVVNKDRNNENQAASTLTFEGFSQKSKTEGIEIHDEKALFKSKLRALKIYNNLKKVKQPISPGGRLTTFLNSLFANAKKSKSSRRSYCEEEGDMKSERKLKSKSFSSCSSASSFSRSCLSKTSSEREKIFNGDKRKVRFYPVSVIVDEENRPCGHKYLYEEEKVKLPVLEKSRVMENDLVLKGLPIRINNANDQRQGFKLQSTTVNDEEDEDDDDDDAASYASSDLFELDHLSMLGNGMHCEELPVYETTHVSTNRAIVNGFII
ncbi:hypothetical protein TanjilG_11360 [Lupinus angustifolius]|uniref:Protein BIG GRAIN 1-like B n=1 Tax=Lupinus angustifolius TaxID=3871 RepID=A0A1J7H8V6_LUPAN|nr:PREDICTED: protein BIG GRAIN 1-like B [Lupinus angustifolius]OIW09222.1 hypothetical protein TanjilG_11360 [Lupinus angustifolius]